MLLLTWQAAELLGIDPPEARTLIKLGLLECVKTPGGHSRVPIESVQRFLNKKKENDKEFLLNQQKKD